MASLRFPTQLVTRGTLNHHHSSSSDNSIPTLPSSSSLNRKPSTVVPVTCTAAAVNLAPGTPARPTSILVVGATGTLGRQIDRRASDEGYDVRCLVRPRPAPVDFLRDWGATVVNVHCATGRPEEPIKTVDWEGKVALIQCAKAVGIQKYVFYSIHNCDKHPEVPLMEIKYCTEKFLQESGLNHITIRLCGFKQAVWKENFPDVPTMPSSRTLSSPRFLTPPPGRKEDAGNLAVESSADEESDNSGNIACWKR
ncbi:NmrA-like domain-containing protein [Hirschfeldia incana]|nr:NmrA-like domain-containing protein [Hirschfeldia incana]